MKALFSRFSLILCILCALCGSAAFAAPAQPSSLDSDDDYLDKFEPPIVPDPLEPWNRAVFRFNDFMLDQVARPVYQGYAYITPQFMRTGIKNFFHNISFPVRFVNNLLQGKGKAAGVEMSRFILNSTAGLGGLFDVAKYHEPVVPVEDEDFGQTLGAWGAGEGFYIVWPLLGPSTVRDTTGLVADTFLEPTSYLRPWGLRVGVKGGKIFNELDDILDHYDELKRAAIEPYTSVRDAYVQYRRAKIAK